MTDSAGTRLSIPLVCKRVYFTNVHSALAMQTWKNVKKQQNDALDLFIKNSEPYTDVYPVGKSRNFSMFDYCARVEGLTELHTHLQTLTWNPAESLVYDVSRRLKVLHRAASRFSCYDIRDMAIEVQAEFYVPDSHQAWGAPKKNKNQSLIGENSFTIYHNF
ncbi:hypothetical protein CSKR_113274 [Clonorchis sinensis]|uniref:Uncharacterized protein n=1 Tax=Clonorchis sinensis TaxID=79923 RepID=A0A3R7D8A0_CLOSI|nr:hypothetical protein CSKR_113274 [Clonorchis sinensis]